MAITLNGAGLTIEKLVKVARHNEKVSLHPDAEKRIKKCRAMLEKKIKAKESKNIWFTIMQRESEIRPLLNMSEELC